MGRSLIIVWCPTEHGKCSKCAHYEYTGAGSGYPKSASCELYIDVSGSGFCLQMG